VLQVVGMAEALDKEVTTIEEDIKFAALKLRRTTRYRNEMCFSF
jgi:hypothetical protein